MEFQRIINKLLQIFEKKKKNAVLLENDTALSSDFKVLKVGVDNTPIQISKSELKIIGKLLTDSLDIRDSLTVGGSEVITEASDVDSLNDLSDVSYANGDLTITDLDTIVAGGALILDVTTDITLNADGDNITFKAGTKYIAEMISGAATDFRIHSAVGTANFFNINTSANGETTILTSDSDGTAGHLTINPNGLLKLEADDGGLLIKETADAGTDVAGYGQLWVHDDAPNTLWFTDDTGVDMPIAQAGQIIGYTRLQGDLTNYNSYEIQNSMTVEDAAHQITFITPPSEFVEIECNAFFNHTSTDSELNVGLSDSSTYNKVGEEFEYDVYGLAFSDDEADKHMLTWKFVLGADDLAAIGSSNTFYIGFSTGGTTKTVYLQYGLRSSHGLAYPPFVIKATALPKTIYDGE